MNSLGRPAAFVCYGALRPLVWHCATLFMQVVRINLVLIDNCHSLMLAKGGEDYTEAACTDAYLQLRRQLPTELRRFMYILIVTQTSAELG